MGMFFYAIIPYKYLLLGNYGQETSNCNGFSISDELESCDFIGFLFVPALFFEYIVYSIVSIFIWPVNICIWTWRLRKDKETKKI